MGYSYKWQQTCEQNETNRDTQKLLEGKKLNSFGYEIRREK